MKTDNPSRERRATVSLASFYMREFARQFYKSTAWKNCREAYISYRSGLCEKCLQKGIYSAGEIVHHKKELTPQNIDDPNVTLSFDNLELVCRKCHAEEHEAYYNSLAAKYRKTCYKWLPDGTMVELRR